MLTSSILFLTCPLSGLFSGVSSHWWFCFVPLSFGRKLLAGSGGGGGSRFQNAQGQSRVSFPAAGECSAPPQEKTKAAPRMPHGVLQVLGRGCSSCRIRSPVGGALPGWELSRKTWALPCKETAIRKPTDSVHSPLQRLQRKSSGKQ